MGCGASSKRKNVAHVVVAPSEPAASALAESATDSPIDRKLNVVVLHGTTMDGDEMKSMYKWKECGIHTFCEDIANFYYPTGPCVVAKNHEFWKSQPKDRKERGDKARHWWTMTDKWQFEDNKFGDARKVILKCVNEEVKGTVDVIIGYSQGAAATTQVLNDLHKGKMSSEHLKHIRGVVFHGCPAHPAPLREACLSVSSLHCNGKSDPLTSLAAAKKHAAAFNDDTFFEFDGGHEVRKIQQKPVRDFLLKVKNGGKDTE